MKSSFKLAGALLLMASSAAFAATQTTAHPATQAPAASHPAAMTKADVKAEKKQIRADENTALAACKNMKSAEKSACRKEAMAKAANARAHLKAAKHT
ncbi:hypothetical protein [Massilia sp. GCM10023247]|uniref:hypothetical protein n=1 Tax=Massilia sp. GCM10023247 TaxID=3252643 RepID=UPI003607515A